MRIKREQEILNEHVLSSPKLPLIKFSKLYNIEFPARNKHYSVICKDGITLGDCIFLLRQKHKSNIIGQLGHR